MEDIMKNALEIPRDGRNAKNRAVLDSGWERMGRRDALKAAGLGAMGVALGFQPRAVRAGVQALPFDVRMFVDDPDGGPNDVQCSYDRLNVTGNLFPHLPYAQLLPLPLRDLLPMLEPGLQILVAAGLLSDFVRIRDLLAVLGQHAPDLSLIDLFGTPRDDPMVNQAFDVLVELFRLGLTLPLPPVSEREARRRRSAAEALVKTHPDGAFQTLFTTPSSEVRPSVLSLVGRLKELGFSLVASGGYNYRCCIGRMCTQTDKQLWCNTITSGGATECSECSDSC
jgi:hypothetical protein